MILHFNKIETNPSICIGKKSDATVGSGFPEGETTEYAGLMPDNGGKIIDGQSILKMLEQVMLQVEYHCFADLRFKRIDPLYKELCLIIAEVLLLDQDSTIKINSSNICVRLVREVYLQIRNDHVQLVFNNFHNVSQRIFNKKSYLRTALYNAVFEIESFYVNDMALID